MVKINFQFLTSYGTYSDALYFPDGEVPTDDVIAQMKEERLNNWVAAVTSPLKPPSKYQRDENGNLILDANGDPIPTGA